MPHWLPLQDRPDGSSAGQRMRSNPENQIHPLKTQPKPFPSISLPFEATISQEHGARKDFGHRPQLRGSWGVQEGTRSSNMGELVVLNLMHFKISLWISWQAG